MGKRARLLGVLTPVLAQFGLELEAVEIVPTGKRRLLRVVVDGDGREVRGRCWMRSPRRVRRRRPHSTADLTGAAPYTLEVSSRGVSRPLELPDTGGGILDAWSRYSL